MQETLLKLLAVPGISGYESTGGISQLIAQLAGTNPRARVITDSLGNVLVTIGKGNRILVEAHQDEVGFLVSKFLTTDVVQLIPVGGIREERVLGASIQIVGAQKTSTATFQSAFQAQVSSPDQVQPGHWCYFTRSVQQNDDLITSPALDNRVSCAVLLELAKTISVQNIELNFLFATQHEQGSPMSILNWVNQLKPELVIICDSAYAQPNGEPSWNIPQLGKGTAIQLIGTDFIVNGKIIQELLSLAQKNKIDVQFEIPAADAGGTDASKVPNSIPFAVINTPVRNQHTGAGQADVRDLHSSFALLSAYLKNLDHQFKE